MTERIPPTNGQVIAGVFLLLLGLVLLLAGGACTALWITGLASASGSQLTEAVPMLLISLGTVVIGALALKGSISCFRGKVPPAPPPA